MDRALREIKKLLDHFDCVCLHSLKGPACVCARICVPASIWLQASMAKISLEERKVRAMPVVKALPCGEVGLFVASTLVLLHCVLQESTGTGLVVSNSLKFGAGLSLSPSVLPSLSRQGHRSNSRASTTVHHHGRDLAVDDLLFTVKVEHVDG